MKIIENGIYEINLGDKEYPDELRKIQDPPKEIYARGNLELLNKPAIAVVGSRKATEYGKQVSMKIGKEIVRNGLVHISGMAKGIDRYSHVGVLKENGCSIAVLGCGVDVCYPRENEDIYNDIIKNGLIISELPPGTEPRKYAFPRRNRIIAGLCHGVVIVEANTNSGSLLTAQLAESYGKYVFAVPGNIFSHQSLGTNKLIADGASIVTVVDDIFCQMGIEPVLSETEIEGLGEDEISLLNVVKSKGEVSVEELCLELNITPVNANALISILEMKGIVAYDFGKVFVIKS